MNAAKGISENFRFFPALKPKPTPGKGTSMRVNLPARMEAGTRVVSYLLNSLHIPKGGIHNLSSGKNPEQQIIFV